eukprot:TRINITY_DN28578_c0_g1_i1.p4 TRINITY_DN28578_c0_g1~~TRINITY_DN28578_c0_g1_i1.p4  ORF type:complete len:120 (-),score=24.66 TRINITY_DN28578_c0_g1_i1:111-470(-)
MICWLLVYIFLYFVFSFFFFFFKQKTAYEMQRGLVGSEMCIRDRQNKVKDKKKYERKRTNRKGDKLVKKQDKNEEIKTEQGQVGLNKRRQDPNEELKLTKLDIREKKMLQMTEQVKLAR